MPDSDIDTTTQKFIIQLFKQTKGDPSVQASMYDIGETLGLDRELASRVAEELMGLQLVEIRTLSGGIGISSEGLQMIQRLTGGSSPGDSKHFQLGDDLVLGSHGCRAVQQIASEIKEQAGSLGLDFDTLSELMADLKTIDAQLDSSRPKTAIVRECFRSIIAASKNAESSETFRQVHILLNE
ncbi:MAG: hypothetical protein PVG70_08510 [Desulfobacterales bacterium]